MAMPLRLQRDAEQRGWCEWPSDNLTRNLCTGRTKSSMEREQRMPKKTFTPEQIVATLRQIEVLVDQGQRVPPA